MSIANWIEDNLPYWKETEAKYKDLKQADFDAMDLELLRELAQIKNKRGVASAVGTKAQKALFKQRGMGLSSSYWTRNHTPVHKI